MHAVATDPINLKTIHIRLKLNCDRLKNVLKGAKYLKVLIIDFDTTDIEYQYRTNIFEIHYTSAVKKQSDNLRVLLNTLDTNNKIEVMKIREMHEYQSYGLGNGMREIIMQMPMQLPSLKSFTLPYINYDKLSLFDR